MLKLVIAFNTFGTNDAVSFYQFGKALNENGLEWTYRHSIPFNHPPLIADYLRAIYQLDHRPFFRDNGLTFPFLLRLPGIIADLITVVALCWMTGQDRQFRMPAWALALFALSPVSIMVTGFHGNTDPVMVMFLVLASLFCLRGKSVWCGLFLALSCQIKIIPLLLLPIFFFFWVSRRRAVSFAAICPGLACFVGRTAAEISRALFQECFVLRKFLGNLGHHLLVAPDQSSDVQDGNVLSFPTDGKLRRHRAEACHHRCRLNDCVAAAKLMRR